MDFGLPQKTILQIKHYFQSISDISSVKIFGSRAKGNYKNASDIDLVIWGDNIDQILNKIKYELEELPTPYKFDVVDYDSIENDNLKASIDKDGIIFYQK